MKFIEVPCVLGGDRLILCRGTGLEYSIEHTAFLGRIKEGKSA
jgi:hypothetical protein